MSVLPRIDMSVRVQLHFSYFQPDNNLAHLFKLVSRFSNIAIANQEGLIYDEVFCRADHVHGELFSEYVSPVIRD